MRAAALLSVALLAGACSPGPPGPAALDTRNDACAECRMAVSNRRFASQIVAPGEEPRMFDDLGCLAAYLRSHQRLPPMAAVYVADHSNGEWTPASSAVFTRVDGLATPMDSHVLAHASPASRDADVVARGGKAVTAREYFGGALPDGTR